MDYKCCTDYVIFGNEEDISAIKQTLLPLLQTGEPEEKAKLGLLEVAQAFKVSPTSKARSGYLTGWSTANVSDTILFSVYTPSVEDNKLWKKIFRRYKSVSFLYCAENDDSHYYVTNERNISYFQRRFVIEKEGGDRESYGYEEDMFRAIYRRTSYKVLSVKEARRALRKHNKAQGDEGRMKLYAYKIRED